jgi:glucose/arabinose dehydrogenase
LTRATGSSVIRCPLAGEPEAIVINLPPGGHEARNFVIDPGGALYVNIGSLSNSCQQQDRGLGSPGFDPCTELATRAGIWRFDAEVPGQVPDSSNRFATGIRNAMGMAVHPADGLLYATQHGRDQFFQNWPELFNEKYSAENPAEVLVQVSRGDDFGWPYCYHLGENGQMVVAPEYGGDGRRTDRCSAFKGPVAFFPGHWAPMDLLFYTGNQFPEKYRGGAFIPFHGSWNRAPEPQDGFRVVFQPFSAGRPAGKWETFADGFAGALKTPDGAVHRPMGVAQAPDGSLYVTDDRGGRIWRISWARR